MGVCASVDRSVFDGIRYTRHTSASAGIYTHEDASRRVGDAKMAHETFNAIRPSVEDYTCTPGVLDFEIAGVRSD